MRTWAEYRTTFKPVELTRFDLLCNVCRRGELNELAILEPTPQELDQCDDKGHSLLMLAAYNEHLELTQKLLTMGANPNSMDHEGRTILMGVAFKGNLHIAILLVKAGANVGARNDRGQTAHDFAQMFGRLKMVDFLNGQTGSGKEQLSLKNFLQSFFKSWLRFLFPKTFCEGDF